MKARWDKKDGLYRNEAKSAMAHLRSLNINKWSVDSGARDLAAKLLNFHEQIIWTEPTASGTKRDRGRSAYQPMKRQRQATACHDANTVNNDKQASPRQNNPTANKERQKPFCSSSISDPWNCLLSAARSAKLPIPTQEDKIQHGREATLFQQEFDSSSELETYATETAHSGKIRDASGTIEEHQWTPAPARPSHWRKNQLENAGCSSEPSISATPVMDAYREFSLAGTGDASASAPLGTGSSNPFVGDRCSPFADTLASGSLDVLWPHTSASQPAHAEPSSDCNMFSTQEGVPTLGCNNLNSNDLDLLWTFSRHCGANDAIPHMQTC